MKFFFLWFAQCTHSFLQIKGTVSVISSNHPCKDGNVRFTTVPLKSSDQVWNRYPRFFSNWLFSHLWVLNKSYNCAFFAYRKKEEIFRTFRVRIQSYRSHFWSDKGFKGNVVNRALSSEICMEGDLKLRLKSL